jgi:hypothetical protein
MQRCPTHVHVLRTNEKEIRKLDLRAANDKTEHRDTYFMAVDDRVGFITEPAKVTLELQRVVCPLKSRRICILCNCQ